MGAVSKKSTLSDNDFNRIRILAIPSELMDLHSAMEGNDAVTVCTDVESLRCDEIEERTLEQHAVCKEEDTNVWSDIFLNMLVVCCPPVAIALVLFIVAVIIVNTS